MRLIDDNGVVLIEESVVLNLRQQNTVGHQFDLGVVRNLIVKTHFIADKLTERGLHLFGNAVRHRARRQTAWLSMTD